MDAENIKTATVSSALSSAKITAPSTEELSRDAGYLKSQQLLKAMLEDGMISLSEFNKITALNRKTFSPYLVEIMPKITG